MGVPPLRRGAPPISPRLVRKVQSRRSMEAVLRLRLSYISQPRPRQYESTGPSSPGLFRAATRRAFRAARYAGSRFRRALASRLAAFLLSTASDCGAQSRQNTRGNLRTGASGGPAESLPRPQRRLRGCLRLLLQQFRLCCRARRAGGGGKWSLRLDGAAIGEISGARGLVEDDGGHGGGGAEDSDAMKSWPVSGLRLAWLLAAASSSSGKQAASPPASQYGTWYRYVWRAKIDPCALCLPFGALCN